MLVQVIAERRPVPGDVLHIRRSGPLSTMVLLAVGPGDATSSASPAVVLQRGVFISAHGGLAVFDIELIDAPKLRAPWVVAWEPLCGT